VDRRVNRAQTALALAEIIPGSNSIPCDADDLLSIHKGNNISVGGRVAVLNRNCTAVMRRRLRNCTCYELAIAEASHLHRQWI